MIYLFHRESGFYPVDLPDDLVALANVGTNPGTIKVTTPDGREVWPRPDTEEERLMCLARECFIIGYETGCRHINNAVTGHVTTDERRRLEWHEGAAKILALILADQKHDTDTPTAT